MRSILRRLLGVVLLAPLGAMIAIVAPTCQRGTVSGAGGPGLGSEWLNNLAALGLMASVPIAIYGLLLLFGKPKKTREGQDR